MCIPEVDRYYQVEVVIIIGNIKITLLKIGDLPLDFEDGRMIALSEP